MFHGHLDHFQTPPLGGRPNTKLGDLGTLNAHNRWFILFYHVWGPARIEIHGSSTWLRAQSHMTSHYIWGSVNTLQDFGGVLGQPLDTFFWGLKISWSRLLARVSSGLHIHLQTLTYAYTSHPLSKSRASFLWHVPMMLMAGLSRMVMLTKFWARNHISYFWCPILDPHLNTHHSCIQFCNFATTSTSRWICSDSSSNIDIYITHYQSQEPLSHDMFLSCWWLGCLEWLR